MITKTKYSLTASQLKEYADDGFLVLKDWLNESTIQELLQAANDLLNNIGPIVYGNPRIQVDQIGETTRVRQVHTVTDISEPFARLVQDARMLEPLLSLFTLGARYYAEKPEGGPDWGLRFVVTFLFPK